MYDPDSQHLAGWVGAGGVLESEGQDRATEPKYRALTDLAAHRQ